MNSKATKYIVLLVFLVPTIAKGHNNHTIRCTENVYTLSLGDLSFSVSAETGGRIVSFRRGESELLTTDAVNPVYYGATFWLSPQANYWPPCPAIDKLPYEVRIDEEKLSMTSQIDNTNICITKEFSISVADTSIYINYKIKNTSDKIRKLAPWDVSRVSGGLSFFPIGEKDDQINKPGIPTTYIENGILWFPFVKEENMPAQKLFSTAKEGWMAHYYKNILFVKCFPDIQVKDTPPGQGEVEFFIAPDGKYIELENHGEYISLAPNQSIEYNQKWFLIPTGYGKTKEDLLFIIRNLNKEIK
ncbi:DUF4380 domain-containing protein [Bacteroides sp. K03]|uniref:DUF4380 domain-containing protein n=1 Tax=unclassified Bacteroides TaxID=2646097 RepID=UPI001C8CD7BA|nr:MULTISPECIES: DUF4380 domain-containing protein [unclassified Bacteroides]MBX9186702.1 DUF4380 domain-containing protein [Bacteroides sp. K03]